MVKTQTENFHISEKCLDRTKEKSEQTKNNNPFKGTVKKK